MSGTFEELSDEEVAEYEQAAKEERARARYLRGECDHRKVSFYPKGSIGDYDAFLRCEDCTFTLSGDEARDARDNDERFETVFTGDDDE